MYEYLAIEAFDGGVIAWMAFGATMLAAAGLIGLGWRLQWLTASALGAVLAAASLFWVSAPAMAQTPAELGAIARQLMDEAEGHARSADQALRDWAAEASQRGDLYQEEARNLAEGNHRRLQEGLTMLEADPFFGDAAEMALAAPEEEGALYVAVSLTMPPDALRALSDDAHRAGAQLVIRGLVDGSFERTLVAAKEIFDEDSLSGVAIEPQVFRAFGVDRVPAFIAASAPVQPCDQGVNCTSAATPHDRLAGNISLAEALRILSQRGQQAPGVAQAALERLEG